MFPRRARFIGNRPRTQLIAGGRRLALSSCLLCELPTQGRIHLYPRNASGVESQPYATKTSMQDLNITRPPSAYAALLADTRALGFDMASEVAVGALLRTLAASKPTARCLELGTGTGLASAWLLDGLGLHGSLVTVDNDDRLLAVARRHLGGDPRLDIRRQDGDIFLREAVGRADRFDLIFADTWSGKYRLLDETLSLLAPGGLYVIDDMLPQANWPEGHGAKVETLMAKLAQRTELRLCSLDWSCGVVLAARV